jgi:hypothetical protein
MKPLVTALIILGAVAGCARNSADYTSASPGMHSRGYPANSSSSDCQAAGGATWDSLTGVCIGAQR